VFLNLGWNNFRAIAVNLRAVP
jgi:hypothetical protein